MGVLGDILRQKYQDSRESKLVDRAVSRVSLTGTQPTKEEVKQLRRGKLSEDDMSPRTQQLLAAVAENSGKAAEIRRMFDLARAGISPEELVKFREGGQRAELAQQLPTAQKADFFNKLSLAPNRASGGVVYDKFATENPIIDNSPESLAKAAYSQASANNKTADAADTRLRTNELAKFLSANTGATAVDAANNKSVQPTPQKVTVLNENGDKEIKFVERSEDGSMRILDNSAQLFAPKTSETRQSRSPETLWQDSISSAQSELSKNSFSLVEPQEVQSRALDIYRLKVNDPSATPPGEAAQSSPNQYQLGDTIEHNGMTYRVDGFDSADGEPLLVPVGTNGTN